jgi:hypothetical protein
MDYETMWRALKKQVLKWLSDPDNTRERDSAYEDVDLLMMRLEVKEKEKMRKYKN